MIIVEYNCKRLVILKNSSYEVLELLEILQKIDRKCTYSFKKFLK